MTPGTFFFNLAFATVAGFLGLWWITAAVAGAAVAQVVVQNVARRYGQVNLASALPSVLVALLTAAVGAGLWGALPGVDRVRLEFDPKVCLATAVYVRLGEDGDRVILIRCDKPDAAFAVRKSDIVIERIMSPKHSRGVLDALLPYRSGSREVAQKSPRSRDPQVAEASS